MLSSVARSGTLSRLLPQWRHRRGVLSDWIGSVTAAPPFPIGIAPNYTPRQIALQRASPVENVGSIIWTRGEIKRFMNRRGNPNGGRRLLGLAVATEFELRVRQLRLTPETYALSHELRRWCLQIRNRYYIPEWLLDAWNISVNQDFSGAA
jgi:hypothetical protein